MRRKKERNWDAMIKQAERQMKASTDAINAGETFRAQQDTYGKRYTGGGLPANEPKAGLRGKKLSRKEARGRHERDMHR